MSNKVMTVNEAAAIFSKDAASVLHDNLHFLKSIAIEDDAQYKKKYNDVSEGQRIEIRKPAKFTTRTGLQFSGQDFKEDSVSLTRANVIGVDISGFTAVELATDLSMEKVKNISDRIVVPAAKQLASDLEAAVMRQLYVSVFNTIGTPGVTPNSKRVLGEARAKLQKFLAPQKDRSALLNSDAELEIGESIKGFFNPAGDVSKVFKEGYFGRIAGFETASNELIPYHTNGNDVTGIAVDGAGQTGGTLHVDGLTTTTGTVTAGSVFTIQGVYAIHPETRIAYDFLQEFTVLPKADGSLVYTADGSGDVDLLIMPEIVTSGAQKTVSAGPADDAPMVFVGAASSTHPQNLAYHKEAFRFMTLPLPKMEDAAMAANATFDNIDITFHNFWDKEAYKRKTRLDVLWGAAAVRGEHAARIYG